MLAAVTPAPVQEDDDDNESYSTAVDGHHQHTQQLQLQNEEMGLKPDAMTEMGVSAATVTATETSTRTNIGSNNEVALTLPESTYSFLFTECVCSVPYVFSLIIAAVSYACLSLALCNNISNGIIPIDVDLSVRIAQYFSILIALLMEEEIPTGLYLLRRISQPYLKSKFPEISYSKFVLSSVMRITMGYLFLVNVLLVIMQAEEVLVIFYDVLALQFLQKLDDIGFSVSKMDVLGNRLQRATMTKYFNVELKQESTDSLVHKWKVRMFLKAVYFFNLAGFLAAMIVVSTRQMSGYYQCDSITVTFGEEIWRDAIVEWPESSSQHPGLIDDSMVLVYGYFNGEYAKDPHRTHGGRPVYIEQKKSDRSPFDETTPLYNPYHSYEGSPGLDVVKPAEIKYCGGRWVFSHEYIKKSTRNKLESDDENDCNWLARTPETIGFDLLQASAQGKWQIWEGVIVESEVSIKCNECHDNFDCNLNGVCNESTGKCVCDEDDKMVYFGTHCEVKLENQCRTIIGEQYNDVWSVDTPSFSDGTLDWTGEMSEPFQEYSRPVYTYVKGLPEGQAPEEGDSFSLIYSGSRWFRIVLKESQDIYASEFWQWMTANYHALWSRAYEPGVTTLVSEPTKGSTPVGVDFYHAGERGSQFGPFGALYPAQMKNLTGRGVYRCNVNICSYCSNGITVDEDFVIPHDFVDPAAAGYTCGFFAYDYAKNYEEGSSVCQQVKLTEPLCCPP